MNFQLLFAGKDETIVDEPVVLTFSNQLFYGFVFLLEIIYESLYFYFAPYLAIIFVVIIL